MEMRTRFREDLVLRVANTAPESKRNSASAVHETTGYSPSLMLFGRDLRLPADILFSQPPDVPLATEEYTGVKKLRTKSKN
ncbi:hypothetical protein TNCV_4417441 [Trichonephila clavipes]|nr:hypothetical protein TNCV_4417441 [Trichonephila clavipes]